jgi:hypothetical protein
MNTVASFGGEVRKLTEHQASASPDTILKKLNIPVKLSHLSV